MLLSLMFILCIVISLALPPFFLIEIIDGGTTRNKISFVFSIIIVIILCVLFSGTVKTNKIETKTYNLSEKYTFNEDKPFKSMGIDKSFCSLSFYEHDGKYIQSQNISYIEKTKIRYKKDKKNKIIVKYGINYYGQKLKPSSITICYKQE